MSFDVQSGSQNVCFPIRLANNYLEYNVALVQPSGYFAGRKHSKGLRSKTCKAIPLG